MRENSKLLPNIKANRGRCKRGMGGVAEWPPEGEPKDFHFE